MSTDEDIVHSSQSIYTIPVHTACTHADREQVSPRQDSENRGSHVQCKCLCSITMQHGEESMSSDPSAPLIPMGKVLWTKEHCAGQDSLM